MEQSDLLRFAAGKFDAMGVRYFVTGSVASTYFGEPRFTNDIDVVADLPASSVGDLCSAFPSPEFYLSEDAVRQAIEHSSQFNIIHPKSGLKIDVMIPERTPFNHNRFARASRVAPGSDWEVCMASPEDVIIMKMAYYKQGKSEKHLRDISSMLKFDAKQFDRDYIIHWSTRLDLMEVWSTVSPESSQ